MDNPRSKLKGLLWIIVASIPVLAWIIGAPLMAKKVPWKLEKKISSYIASSDQFHECRNAESEGILKKILTRIYPLPGDSDLPVKVSVISGETINAFASLGGQIYVYDGLLRKTETSEELAGILAHEIEHVRHRHIMQGVFTQIATYELLNLTIDPSSGLDPRIVNMLVNLKFTREQELEADRDGLKRLQTAHIDVNGFANFFKREENRSSLPSLLSDHPSSENRYALAQKYYRPDTTPVLTVTEWIELKQICLK